MRHKLKVGTRDSALARAQTRLVVDRIRRRYPGWELEVVPLKTSGDLILDRPLDEIGGKGLFIKEIEAALFKGEIDLAVHSLKDFPAQSVAGLKLAAFSEREDPRDVLISRHQERLADLPAGAVVGTSSVRRAMQLLQKRPDLKVAPLRGNVLTRLDKLAAGRYEAIILAAAGLKRLGRSGQITQYFEVDEFIPAIGQGIMVVQTRADTDCEYLWQSGVHCEEAAVCARAERAYMLKLDGGCNTPIAAYAQCDGAQLTVTGLWADLQTNQLYRATVAGRSKQPEQLGVALAGRITAQLRGVK
jgi:hydroxymethylbilane synthase